MYGPLYYPPQADVSLKNLEATGAKLGFTIPEDLSQMAHGKKSIWQGTIEITVKEENIIKEAEIKDVTAGFGVKAIIDAGENNCHWEITVEGIVFLGGEKSGTIYANTQETVRLGFSLAFGNVDIIVKAANIDKEYTAFALGPFFLNLKET